MFQSSLHFTVTGTPAPQGSKRHVGNGRMIESSKKVDPWRQDVREAAARAMTEQPAWDSQAPFIVMHVVFRFTRPRSHYGTGVHSSTVVRSAAPDYPGVRPDLDKLMRSTCDALTSAGAYADDSRVIAIHARKVYVEDGGPTGAHLVLEGFK